MERRWRQQLDDQQLCDGSRAGGNKSEGRRAGVVKRCARQNPAQFHHHEAPIPSTTTMTIAAGRMS